MQYDPKLEEITALAVGLSTGSASAGLQAVENSEQNRARNNCYLPKDMKPSKEAFEALGFQFEEIQDDVLCKATLPNGWTLKSDGCYFNYLIDEKGRKRGSSFYKGAFYDRSGYMKLYHRYHTTCSSADPENDKAPYSLVVMDYDDSIIYCAGTFKTTYSLRYKWLKEKLSLFMKKNFPEWHDPTKYWD